MVRATAVPRPGSPSTAPTGTPRGRFFLLMSAVLATIIVAGFTPTFYLRPFILPPEVFTRYGASLPIHLYVHGALASAWVVLALTQPLLVALGRTDLHRRLGVAGAAVAIGIVPSALVAQARGGEPGLPAMTAAPGVMSIAAFALCAAFAVLARHKPEEHKRLMLMATIPLTPFALDRIINVAAFYGLGQPPRLLVTPGVQFLLLAMMIVFDLVTEHRPHRGTLKGLALTFVAAPLLAAAFALSGAWTAFEQLVR